MQLLAEIRKTSDYVRTLINGHLPVRWLLSLTVSGDPCNRTSRGQVLILETDHVIMRPIPNLATPDTPAAYIFGYMYPQVAADCNLHCAHRLHTSCARIAQRVHTDLFGPSCMLYCHGAWAHTITRAAQPGVGYQKVLARRHVRQGVPPCLACS